MGNIINKANIISILVFALVIGTILIIPFKVVSYGYIPVDDAMRHAAKAVSGKSWNEILVLRDDIKMDSHPGWHAILTAIYKTTGCSVDGLVVFSVVSLFIIFCIAPLFFMKRPEAWLITLLVITIASSVFIIRLLKGRPFIFSMTVIVFLGFIWPRLKLKRSSLPILCLLTFLIAASTWIHSQFYLFALPIISFFIARKHQEGIALTVCTIIGTALGATFTGHPLLFISETIIHAWRCLGGNTLTRILVTELRPFNGDFAMVLVVVAVLFWRACWAQSTTKALKNPIFVLAVVSWILGFVVGRFWHDWGMPAIAVWLSQEFQEALSDKIKLASWQRVGIVFVVAVTLFLSITSDYDSRWTYNLSTDYLTADKPNIKGWLPEPGGIVYSNDMTIFYQMFYKNPKAPWRYMLGFEPTMMTADDLAILRKIQWNFGAGEAFEPWRKRMRPEDRIIIRGYSISPPNAAGLEWYYAATGIWIGRLPRKAD